MSWVIMIAMATRSRICGTKTGMSPTFIDEGGASQFNLVSNKLRRWLRDSEWGDYDNDAISISPRR
jgi:hypothetical protein